MRVKDEAAPPTRGARDDGYLGQARPTLAILWISVLGLYLELLLIRWIGTEIRIFAYLQNTVLVVCFFGLGLGLFTSRRPIRLWRGAWALTLLAALLAFPATREVARNLSFMLSLLGEINIWNPGAVEDPATVGALVATGLVITLLLMVLVLEPFVPIGRLLGRLMDDHAAPIVAYSVNIGGSLLGIWLFVVLSRFNQPPTIWFAILLLLYLPFFVRRGRLNRLSLMPLAAIVPLVYLSGTADGALRTVWSPYQKLSVFAPDSDKARQLHGPAHLVEVNNTGYQTMIDLGPGAAERAAQPEGPIPPGFGQYDMPFLLHPGARSVLIVGAGAGNDAAGALRHGARRVTAVEIDPAIIDFGREYHAERPYDDPRVRVVLDDARSFFATTAESFDVIIFGLLDSHTTTAMTNARLDHYVYTRESLRRARELLAEGGTMFLAFEADKPFIADRIAGVLREAFRREPRAFRIPPGPQGVGGVMFVTGNLEAVEAALAGDNRLAAVIARLQRDYPVSLTYATVPATDDWPYLYLEGRRIPALFYLLGGMMALLVLQAVVTHGMPGGMNPTRWPRSNWHFFFLGAGFLLLEVQNISKAAVVLGNTWLVNAVIISGVLFMILVANLTAIRWPRLPLGPVWAALILSALGLYFVDLARFAFLPYPAKATIVGLLSTLPMLFSGIVFVRSFVRVGSKDIALGANLLGALVGALLQSISFAVGIKALLLVVAAAYALALLTRPRAGETEAALDARGDLGREALAVG